MEQIENLYSRKKILVALDKVTQEFRIAMKGLSLDDFFTRPQGKWSACDTLQHLIKSAGPLYQAMRLPKFILAAAFGKSDLPSKQYHQIQEAYLTVLSQGAGAGRFAPPLKELPASQAEAEAVRKDLLLKWQKTGHNLSKVIQKWSNRQLDKHLLPHPLLGKLSVREMLLFTIYHNLHHLNTVKQRVQMMHTESKK